MLTDEEITKIMEAETRYDRLYEILINIFYQKDEPIFQSLLEKEDDESKSRFSSMYLDLVLFSAYYFCFIRISFLDSSLIQLKFRWIPAFDIYE